MAEDTTATEVPAAADEPVRRRETKRVYSQPVFYQSLTVQSMQAQRVMNRSFRAVTGSLFRIDVILRIISNPAAVDVVEKNVIDNIKKVAEELEKEISATKGLMEENGIDELPTYSSPETHEIEIKSPQIASFARLVARLDVLMGQIDTLWINGSILDNKQRSIATYQWQQRLIRLAGRIIGLEKRARIAAYNAGKRDEVDSEAPVDAHEADAKTVSEEAAEIDKETTDASIVA